MKKSKKSLSFILATLLFASVLGVVILAVWNPDKESEDSIAEESLGEELPQVGFGQTMEQTFALTNGTQDAMFVEHITASCTCTQIKDHETGVLPGDTLEFTAVFRGDALGRNEIDIDVHVVDRGIEKFRLSAIVTPPESFVRFAENERQRMVEKDYLVSAEEVITKIQGAGRPLVFDFRSASLALLGSIPNAIKISLAEIDAYPSGGEAVLLGSPILQSGLQKKIDALTGKLAGFSSIRMIEGGLRAWRIAGGSLVGADKNGVDLYSLNGSEVQRVVGRTDWQVVTLGKASDQKGLELLFPEYAKVSGDFTNLESLREELLAIFDRASRDKKKLLLVSERGEGYQWIEGLLEQSSPVPVHYLRGGLAHYFDAMSRVPTLPTQSERKLITMVDYNGQRTPASRRETASDCSSCPK